MCLPIDEPTSEHEKRCNFIEGYTNVSDILSYYLNMAIKKEITVDEALSEATKKINEKVILVK